ncbi:nuclear factor Y, subunit B11 [Tasmannia lanceolata]|uniref:nuclear factor Y, subunit B11 n=1 Tax=Tasmannia lanceolata TaxID=3420 RepID=UPI0040628E57
MARAGAEVEDLPRTIVRRVVKEKLSESSQGQDISVHKDALLAFSESARIFIHYLSATANDVCKESKRQTINADDVFKALEEIEFPEFIEPLKASLDDFRQKNAAKKSGAKAKDSEKKRKIEEGPSALNGEDVGEDAEEEGGGEEDVEEGGGDEDENVACDN